MSQLRVLIVDDERLFAELMRVALSNAPDIEVLGVVHDVATAVASAAALRPAVVLSDYHLPDGTGGDVARTLRRTAPEVSTGSRSAYRRCARAPARWGISRRPVISAKW